MAEALITPDVLRWARERAGLSVDGLAVRMKQPPDKLAAWESGEKRPTFKQAETLAKKLHVPFGYFFLPEPPQEEIPLPDLRTLPDTEPGSFSAEFRDLIQDVQYKLSWYRDYLHEVGADPPSFVGRFDGDADVETVARDIRDVLAIDALQEERASEEEYLTSLFDRCEQAGVWVMRLGYVGSNTNRTLSVQEFRGFAIADAMCPVVVINSRDARAAQAFTLAHELAHIWLGQSGVSNPTLTERTPTASVERRCNAIAAEVLVPRERIDAEWRADEPIHENVRRLRPRFRVSGVALARRAADLGHLAWDDYLAFHREEERAWAKQRESGGGDFHRTARTRQGRLFSRAVMARALSGALPLREAGRLLNMNPATVIEHAKRRMGE